MRKIMFALSLAVVLMLATASVYADFINLPVKWSQRPDMEIGKDHLSVDQGAQGIQGPIVADDFISSDPSPVIAVRWWGSYLTPDGGAPAGYTPPAGFAVPFHISFHFDIPDTEPTNPQTWSQPGNLISLQTVLAQEEFYGTVPDPEMVFMYNAFLTIPFDQGQYHNKDASGNPIPTVFWIDIDRLDRDDWGWHEALTKNIDDAVTGPTHNGAWTPLMKKKAPTVSADMAFELMTIPEPGSLLLLGSGLLGLIGYARKRFTV